MTRAEYLTIRNKTKPSSVPYTIYQLTCEPFFGDKYLTYAEFMFVCQDLLIQTGVNLLLALDQFFHVNRIEQVVARDFHNNPIRTKIVKFY